MALKRTTAKAFSAMLVAAFVAVSLTACRGSSNDNSDIKSQLTGSNSSTSSSASQGVSAPSASSSTGTGSSSGDVSFGLQENPDPNFDSPSVNNSDKLYTIVGDYAYELDPTTLQPTGPALDPISHEPVENPVEDGNISPSTPNNPQANNTTTTPDTTTPTTPDTTEQTPNEVTQGTPTQGEDNQNPPDSSSSSSSGSSSTQAPSATSKPTAQTKLPNTGEFLEDD